MKTELLIDYLAHELSPEEEAKVEVELENNVELQKLLSELCYQRFLWAEAHRNKVITLSSDFQLPDLQQKVAPQPPKKPMFSTPFWTAVAASICLFLGLTIYTSVHFKQILQTNRVVSQIVEVGPNVCIAQVDKKITVMGPTDIHEQDRILVPVGSFALIKYSDGSLIKLRAKSIFETVEGTRGKYVYLRTGKLSAKIAHQPKDEMMTFGTPHGEIDILGTEFEINSQTRRGTYVHLFQGKVSFRNYNDNSVIQLTDSEWAMIAPNMDFIPRLGSRYRYKDGKQLFDLKQAKWVLHKATIEHLPGSVVKITSNSTEEGTATIQIPSLFEIPSKALALEFEAYGDEPQTRLNTWFLINQPKKKTTATDARMLKPFRVVPNANVGKWFPRRFELDSSMSESNPFWFHLRAFHSGKLVLDEWLEGHPHRYQFLVTNGSILIRNIRVIERVPDPFESNSDTP